MSSRVFQSVIVQMKEATDRVIGVIDADSNVISCSDTSLIGEKWPEAVIKLNSAPDSVVVVDKKTFKPLVSWSAYFDYAVFAEGDDETARSLCVMAYVALNGAKTYYEEKHDKGTFVKNIITDNILPGDIYIRAKELHFVTDAPRAVFLVRQVGRADVASVDVLSGMFPDKQQDFVLSINETDIAIVKQLAPGTEKAELLQTAQTPWRGERMRWARSPSFVSRSRPSVSLSSLPTGMTPSFRYASGTRSMTVFAFGSSAAVR